MITLTLDPVLAGALLSLLLAGVFLGADAALAVRRLRRRLRASQLREQEAIVDAIALERVMDACPRCRGHLHPEPPPRA